MSRRNSEYLSVPYLLQLQSLYIQEIYIKWEWFLKDKYQRISSSNAQISWLQICYAKSADLYTNSITDYICSE